MARQGFGGAAALVRPTVSGHMWSMSGRPCNPGSDLRQLWQALLGKNTPFPQCGMPEKQDVQQADAGTPDRNQPDERQDAAPAQRNR